MYRLDLTIVQIDDKIDHDKGNVYVQGTYSLLYSAVYNSSSPSTTCVEIRFRRLTLRLEGKQRATLPPLTFFSLDCCPHLARRQSDL